MTVPSISPGHKQRKGAFSFLALICFWIGVALLFLTGDLFRFICWSFLCVLAPLFGIAGNVTSSISYWKKEWQRLIFWILFEVVVLLIFGMRLVPYIYTAPALSNQGLQVYKEMIGFVKDHNDFNDIDLDKFGRVGIGNTFCILDGQNSGQSELLRIVNNDEIPKLLKISREFRKIGCFRAFRRDDFVFFVSHPSVNGPGRFGAVYSLYGGNPNDIDDNVFKRYRPFVSIVGNWYMSRTLILRPHLLISMPPQPNNSLIDHSLRIEDVNIGSGD
jgi:hypothetical protein